MWNLTGDNATSKSSRSLLPVLTILFLVSYGLLTMLVVEQGRTIDSQRGLIHLLFSDSVQLSSIKGKAAQKQNAEAQARARRKRNRLRRNRHRQIRGNRPRLKAAGGREKSEHQQIRATASAETSENTVEQGDERRALISI